MELCCLLAVRYFDTYLPTYLRALGGEMEKEEEDGV